MIKSHKGAEMELSTDHPNIMFLNNLRVNVKKIGDLAIPGGKIEKIALIEYADGSEGFAHLSRLK
jgi:hypothetical protein